MSVQVANVNLSGAVVGQTGTIVKFGNLLPPPTLAQQMRPQDNAESQAHLVVFNETGCLLTITLPESKQTKTVPSGRWWQFPIPPHETEVDYLVLGVASNPIFNSLLADFYGPGEPVDDMGTLGNSPIGGGVPLSVSSVANDGNPTITTFIESTPSGGAQTWKGTNDGHLVLSPNNPNTGTDVAVTISEQNNPVTQGRDAAALVQQVAGDAFSRVSARIRGSDGFGQLGVSDGTSANTTSLFGTNYPAIQSTQALLLTAQADPANAGTTAGVRGSSTAGTLDLIGGSVNGWRWIKNGASGYAVDAQMDINGNFVTLSGLSLVGLGVPLQVAQGLNVAINNTTAVNIINFTLSAGAVAQEYELAGWYNVGVGNTNVGVVTFKVVYNDTLSGTSRTEYFIQYGTLNGLNANNQAQTGTYTNCYKLPIRVLANANIVVSYQNTAAGTIADRATAILYRLV